MTMDFDFDVDQRDLVAAVDMLLKRHAGPERARAMSDAGDLDAPLMEALIDGGFADPAEFGAGPLEAVLVTELVAAAAGRAPFASRALVAPAVLDEHPLPSLVAVVDGEAHAPVRFAQHADVLIALRDTTVYRIEPSEVSVTPVQSPFAYPQAVVSGLDRAGTPISSSDASTLRRWRHVALAAEMVGSMHAALRLTASYVAERRAFGHPLGAMQAIQHRLAELHIAVDGARWLVRRAAFDGAPAEAAATACSAAAGAAQRLIGDTHQVTGAMGLTREYDLYLWTMALASLLQEAGGLAAHREAVAAARWAPDSPVDHFGAELVPRHSIEDGGGPNVAAMI
jgi:alkylation response protein AidB-like acyl-CoA dehydrogenase